MSEAQERQETSFDPTGHTSPGQQLRRERERQGLDLEEVAVQLNLRPAVVAGLEEDRYDEVPIPAYRRGYLRAYARLMGIDERQIVDAYNTQHGRSDLDRRVTPVHVAKPPSRIGAWIFKLVTLLVILGLIGLTLLWWQSRNGNELLEGLGLSETSEVSTAGDGAATGDAVQTPASAEEGGTTLPPLPEENDELGLVEDSGTAQPQASASGDEASMIQPDTASAPPGDDTIDGEASTAADVATATSSAVDTGEVTQAASSNDAGQAEDAAPAPAAATDDRRLELTFKEQSWTEIYDTNGQRILVGLQPAGTQATVEGDPPFRLTIGNASGVELQYRGEPVDLGARAGGNNVARFTLGE